MLVALSNRSLRINLLDQVVKAVVIYIADVNNNTSCLVGYNTYCN